MVRRAPRPALLAALLTLMAVPALATGQPRPRGGDALPPRERLAALVRERLGLTDDQARRLRDVSARFGRERQALVGEERRTRRAMRDALRAGADANGAGVDQKGIAAALDQLLALQQRRLTLLQEEQRELARFLTPSQRAEYLGMQERAMRAAQRFRQDRTHGPAGGGRPGGPP
jgi:Spy/CpxP family protein refolding chaperone